MMRAFLVLALSSVAFAFFNQQNGDKQLNNVVSRAISVLSARGALQRIQWYYTNGEINNQVPLSTSQCTRDSPLSYVGTLSNAVNRRSIRFCLSGADLGDVSKGAPYGNATEDIPLLAVTNGSLYGPSIDAGKFIALESSFILGIPISASFTICKTNIDGWFYTIYNCLAADLCDVSLPVVNHLPQWEPFVDFSSLLQTLLPSMFMQLEQLPKFGKTLQDPFAPLKVLANSWQLRIFFRFRNSSFKTLSPICGTHFVTANVIMSLTMLTQVLLPLVLVILAMPLVSHSHNTPQQLTSLRLLTRARKSSYTLRLLF